MTNLHLNHMMNLYKSKGCEVMKYVLIGCGRVAGNHIKAAMDNGLEIAALCDIEIEKAKALAEKYGLQNVDFYSDYKEMLHNVKPDFTAIAVWSGAHCEIAEYCGENGFNFLVEKPLAMSIAQAQRVIDAAKRGNAVAGVCHQNRFNTAVQELRRAIDKGRFGKISHGNITVRWCRTEEYYAQDSWRGKWESDGGALMNQCIHGIDLLRWMLGDEIESVYGFVRNSYHPYIEAEDVGVAVISFKNGAVATVEGTVNAIKDYEETLSVFGEQGMVRLGGMSANTIDTWQFATEENCDAQKRDFTEQIPNVYGNGHTSIYYDMVRAIKDGTAPYVDLEAGKRAVELVLAIYKSQKTGERVDFPLENFASTDMI